MPLLVKNIPGRRGYAILEGTDFRGCTACTFEYLGQFVGADGRLTKAPFACRVEAMPERSDALILGPHIVDFIHDEVSVTVRSATGDVFGQVIWSGIVRSANEGSVTPEMGDQINDPPPPVPPPPPVQPPPPVRPPPPVPPPPPKGPATWLVGSLVLALVLGLGAAIWFGSLFGHHSALVPSPAGDPPPKSERPPATEKTPTPSAQDRPERSTALPPEPERPPPPPEPPTPPARDRPERSTASPPEPERPPPPEPPIPPARDRPERSTASPPEPERPPPPEPPTPPARDRPERAIQQPSPERADSRCPDAGEALETGLAKSISTDPHELDEAERLLLCAMTGGQPNAGRSLASLYMRRAQQADSVAKAKFYYGKACALNNEEGCRRKNFKLDMEH